MQTARFRFPFDLDLRLTLAPVPGVRFGGRGDVPAGAWWATRTPDGPATLHVTRSGDVIEARAWGPGGSWTLGQVPRLMGGEDDPAEFAPRHPLLVRLQHQLRGLRLGRSDRVFEALLPTILEQKVTGREARRSYRRILARYGEPAPGPVSLTMAPSPERLAGLPYYELHPLGVEQRRARTIIQVAERASLVEQVSMMSLEDGYRRLRAFAGVGAWTASKVMGTVVGDPDAVPVGDYHLPNIVSWALAGEPRGDDERMLKLLEPYHGQRGRVVRMLKAAGVSAPAYGPRAPFRHFEYS